MSPIEKLRAEIDYVDACVRSIHTDAGDDPIEGERAEAFDSGVEYLAEARERLAKLEAREAQRAQLADTVAAGRTETVSGDGADFHINTRTSDSPYDLSTIDRSKGYDSEVIARSISAIESGDGWLRDDHREAATRKVEALGNENRAAEQILLGASPEYRSAFFKHAKGTEAPGSVELTAEERYRMAEVDQVIKSTGFFQPVNESEARALALTNITGKLVPSQLDTSVIITNDGALNPIRAISRVVPVATNVWTGVTSAGVTAGWTGVEGTEVDDDSPSFANPSVTCYMADAFVPISFQGYEDWGRAESELEEMLNDAKFRLEAAAFATGSGSNQPTGIVTALDANTNVEVAMATNSTYALADLYKLKQALPQRWRSGAAFVSAEEYIDRTRQFGTSNNYHGFTVDLTAQDIPQVLGKPWYESDAMSGDLNTSSNNAIVYGNFSQYLIADRIGMVVEFVPNLFGTTNGRPTGQRGWLAHWRVGADSIVDTAFRLLQNPAA